MPLHRIRETRLHMTATNLFSPFRLASLDLPNRIVMAPMTRNRAGPGNAPTALNASYYAQRAGATHRGFYGDRTCAHICSFKLDAAP